MSIIEKEHNLDNSYYKMKINQIITMIGCTVSICITISVFYTQLQVVLTKLSDRQDNQERAIQYIQTQISKK